jgi:hypothetical protein
VALAALCAAPQSIAAQAAYSAANGSSSIVPLHFGFLSAEFAEAKLALNFTQRLDPFNFSLHMSAAARKGQQDVFSKLDFNPGFDVGGRVAYVLQGDGPGYDVFYVGGRFQSQVRNVIKLNNPDVGLNTLDEVDQRTFAASVGFNHAFSEVTIVGVRVEGRRELSSPGVQRAEEWCTPGNSPSGMRVLVCRDRYTDPLPDLWAGHARVDLTIKVADLGSGPHGARLGVITATSVDLVEGANNVLNVALGPSVHVAGYPGHTVAALLFGLRDVSDANGQRPGFSDRFVVQLVLGVPFRMMVGDLNY